MVDSNTESKGLAVLVFGAGAIGTYIGGSLPLQGHRVVFLERPQMAEMLAQRGLRLEISGEVFHIPKPEIAASIDSVTAIEDFDLGIFALKSYDTPTALERLSPWIELLPPVLCLQNGVDNEAAIAAKIGTDNVIAGTVTSAIGRRAAGDIVLERLRGVGISKRHNISDQLVKAMQDAGLKARLYPNPNDMKWSKLLTNLIGNASSAILGMKPEEIFSHAGLFRLEIEQLRETLVVMQRRDIRVVNLPGTPVRLLAFSVRYLPLPLSQYLLKRVVGTGRGGKMPSFFIDLHSGKGKSEVDDLNGAVVRYAAKVGLAAPANQLLNQTLLALTSGELPLDEFTKQPEKLLARWHRQILRGNIR